VNHYNLLAKYGGFKRRRKLQSSKHFCYFYKKILENVASFFGNFAKVILTMLLGVFKIGKWKNLPTRKSLGILHLLRRNKKEEN